MDIIFQGSYKYHFILGRLSFGSVSASFIGQMKMVLYIILFINRIRCKYGCGNDEEWKNYEIDMYYDTYQYQSFSRRNPVYGIHLFHLKDKGSTVWSITKVGAMKPHTGVPNSLGERVLKTNSSSKIV